MGSSHSSKPSSSSPLEKLRPVSRNAGPGPGRPERDIKVRRNASSSNGGGNAEAGPGRPEQDVKGRRNASSSNGGGNTEAGPGRPERDVKEGTEKGRRNGGGNVETGPGRPERDVKEGMGKGRKKAISSNGSVDKKIEFGGEEELVGGWPKWLVDNIPGDVLKNILPKTADSYTKIDKVGQGTYSNVYKAREKATGNIVALKKVRFDTSEAESIKFMAREITILQQLDHPNIVKLQGLATSRMQYSLYLVFDYMPSDLSRLLSRPDDRLSEPQIKRYMHQLLSGLQHCHDKGILHRDLKGSNLLIDRNGMLKIADFGLANVFNRRRPLTSRVVTLWYRAPELLLGSTDYGVGIDLWSAGCLLAEMFVGRPIMPARTEVEQLHKIFKLCGTPSDDYYKTHRLSTVLKPPQFYNSCLAEAFNNLLPSSSFHLLSILLSLDPHNRGSASSALQHKMFQTSPLACDISGLPKIHVEDDDISMVNERRRHRTSKLARRSQSQRKQKEKEISWA